MDRRGCAKARSASDPQFREIVPPSATGKGQKIPRNLTKLGRIAGHWGIGSGDFG
jgi:hypothetical protein